MALSVFSVEYSNSLYPLEKGRPSGQTAFPFLAARTLGEVANLE